MNFANSYLSNLSSIPRTIILIVDSKETIIESYGKQLESFNFEVNFQTLAKFFNKKDYIQLQKLLNNELNSLILHWEIFDFEVSFSKIPNTSNYALFFFDITQYSSVASELKKSKSDLISKTEELQGVFDLAANGISILDNTGTFLYANNFFQKMMGYTMEELYSESCISLSAKEYQEPSRKAVQIAIEEGSVVNFRKVCVSKGGEYINASMSLSYLKSRDEILMITSDITDDIKYQEKLKLQVEEEVKKRTEQYEIMCHQSRLAAMGEMINSIAHQWRQPLNGLGLIVQSLRHINNSKGINQEMLEEIEEEIMEKVNFMSQTIDDFSDFFRISKERETFDVLKNIDDAIRLIDIQLKIHQIEIIVKAKTKNNMNVFGFPNEFRQVIMNMVHNSMMAIVDTNKKHGFIEIALNQTKEFIEIMIRDNGGGIKNHYIPKIFDPYFSTREHGSGIGLYMSKMIIEHHMKGQLAVKNYKQGAQFCIRLKK